MKLSLRAELAQLNQSLPLYSKLTGKTPEEVLAKQGPKLAYALRLRLKELAPGKGNIRRERLEALKAGGGVHVRDTIRRDVLAKYGARSELATRAVVFGKRGKRSVARKGGKRMNLQALMVQRELNVRESGRQFLSISARYPRVFKNVQSAKSKYGFPLSQAGLFLEGGDKWGIVWDPAKNKMQASATAGLQRVKAEAAIALALRDVRMDLMDYINRKLAQNAQKAGLS